MPLTPIAAPEQQQTVEQQPAAQPQTPAVPDPAHVILSAAQTDDKSKADAWEIYHNHEGKEFEDKLAATSLPMDAKSALWQAKTREATTKQQLAQQKQAEPKQGPVEDFMDNHRVPVLTTLGKGAYEGAKGLYHGLMGDEESAQSKGVPTTSSPEVASHGFTPEHLGQTAGSYVRIGGESLKNLGQDVMGGMPAVIPDHPRQPEKSTIDEITDPQAQTLIGKYIMAPSMQEREASEKELEQYYQTHGAASFGHALSAFVHGTLGEYVPIIGPLAGDIMDTGARGDIGGALTKVATLYAMEKAGEAGKNAVKDRVAPYVEKAQNALKSPEVKKAEANVAATAKPREAAQKKYDQLKAQNDAYAASHAQGVATPEAVTKQLDKAKAQLDEATFHHEAAQQHLEEAKQRNTVASKAGRAIGKMLPQQEAPEVPAEQVQAAPAPELKPLGQPKAALPQLGEPQAPPTVSPAHATTTIPQEPVGRPQEPSGPVKLPGGEPVGQLKQLGAGETEPALPEIKQEVLPPEKKEAKAEKPARGRLSDLTVDEKGNVVEKDPLGAHLQNLLEESLKKTKGNENFPAATVEPEAQEEKPEVKTAYDNAMEKRTAEGGKTRVEGAEDRRQEEVPVENERRQAERRVLRDINERTFQESAFGGEGEKRLDTDAYTKAMEQARKELGPDAGVKDVIKRRDELVSNEAKGSKGDVGEQAREANPEPTRAETKKAAAFPKEENTGYEPKKEELVSAGEEGREPAKSAAEYHPAVEQKVSELSDEKLKQLATKHGLNPDEYDFKARDERRHRVERDQLAKDITAQMDDEEKINIGRAAQAAEKEPGFSNRDQSAQARAARAEKLFPRLREEAKAAAAGESTYGSKNKGVTKAQYEQAKFDFMDKASKSNAGADPTMAKDLAQVAAYHFEAGLREFADWSKKMIEELGEKVRPHLQQLWSDVNKGGTDAEAAKLKEKVAATSTKDTDHVQNSMKELGPDAKLSDVMKRAQELKDQASKPVDLKKVVSDYNKKEGLGKVSTEKHEIDPRAKEISEAYDKMKHDPSNPEVKKAYEALIQDVKKQWDALEKAGVKLEPQDEDPYKSYDEMKKDFEDNNRLKVFRGGNPLPEDHPLAKVDPKTGETYNVMFRAVHDAIGHLHGDNDFSEKGEGNAFRTHSQTMSKEAIPAMMTETKGQVSSFFNNGNEFPDQKAGLLPEKFYNDEAKEDFPEKIERPTVKVPKGSNPLPSGDDLIKKYGEGSSDPKFMTFILDDGRSVANTGTDHDRMLGGKATDKNPPRERFIEQGNIRVRAHQGTAGRETAFSIPESGVNAAQLRAILKMSPQLRSGAVMIEVGKPGGKYEVIPYGEATDERIQQTIKNVTGKGEAPQSVGAARAGTSLAKEEPLTADKLKERLPDLAQQHLTPEEAEGITTAPNGKPRAAATAKFVKNMAEIPTVREYVDIARQGEGARDWYSRSAKAFDALAEQAPDYFKEDGDKEKFLGVLAATSPQQSVAMNLREALGFWKEWNDAGRPELSLEKWKEFSDKADEDWKEDGSPRVGGTAKGASKHWDYAPTGSEWKNENLLLKNLTLPETKIPNLIKALRGEDMWPDLTKNQAFKAPSFAQNLRKWLNGKSTGTKYVTNDSWMGLFGGIDKSALSKPENYHPLSVATRAAAEALGWEPEQAQAAIWSFTQALTEKGVEDPELVRHYSEDFKDLLANDLDTRNILEDLGVDLGELDKRLDAIGEKPQVSEVAKRGAGTTAHSVGQLKGRIEAARGKGSIPKPKTVQGSLFKENPSFESRSRYRDEATRFNPDELENEESGLKQLGEKKKPGLKKLR